MGTFSADPTKDFFIDMLTRDIPLEWAILDLIDNCVDGARDKIVAEDLSMSARTNRFRTHLFRFFYSFFALK